MLARVPAVCRAVRWAGERTFSQSDSTSCSVRGLQSMSSPIQRSSVTGSIVPQFAGERAATDSSDLQARAIIPSGKKVAPREEDTRSCGMDNARGCAARVHMRPERQAQSGAR